MLRSSTNNSPFLVITLAEALVLVSALSVPDVVVARSFSEAELRAAATGFPEMPVDSFSLAQLLGRPTSFGSGGPFNDLEFTTFNTDYIDGENGGFDTFMPAAPSRDHPGADRIRYVRTVLNTDLGEGAGVSQGARVVLGEYGGPPFFMRGPDGIDNDYLVLHHFDYEYGAIELPGVAEDYGLVFCATSDGCASEGWFLFHTANEALDLIAFIHPCDALEGGVSGNPPQDPYVLCNASGVLTLDNAAQFRFVTPSDTEPAWPEGLVQYGTAGKDLLGAVAGDSVGNLYFVGNSDGGSDGLDVGLNQVFVYSTSGEGSERWRTSLVLGEGSTFKDAVADEEFLYVCGRTLDAVPGFTNAGRWDGILMKLRLDTGEIVETYQWGNPGIDGYGNCLLDPSGEYLYLSGQGSPDGAPTTDDLYLVAKHRTLDLQPEWIELPRPPAQGFAASSESWGRLAYHQGDTPADDRLLVSGWFMAAGGADAFVAVFEDLDQASPTLVDDRIVRTQPLRAEWIVGGAFDASGRIFLLGYTTGDIAASPLGQGDLFLARFDSDLENPIFRQFGTSESEWSRTFGLLDDRLIVIGNTFGDFAGTNPDFEKRTGDAFIASFDLDLELIEQVQFGSRHDDRALGLIESERIIVAGTTAGAMVEQNAGAFDIYAAEFDPITLESRPRRPCCFADGFESQESVD